MRIAFEISEALRSSATLTIFNLLGQQVARFEARDLQHGAVDWKPNDLPTGLYLARLSAKDHSQTAKLMLIK